ncbi:MAG: hypothetical protein AAGD88_12300 [Bacteroidota bacterium]
MKSKIHLWICLSFLFLGCSNDDNNSETGNSVFPASFTVIGEDQSQVYQFTSQNGSQMGSSSSLTEQLGVPSNYLTIRQNDEYLSFYTFSEDSFSLFRWNVDQSVGETFDSFYTVSTQRSIAWGIDLDDVVLFGYFGPFTARNLFLQRVDLVEDSLRDIPIEDNVMLSFQPLLHNQKLYLSFRDMQGNNKLVLYDEANDRLSQVLDFGTAPFSFLVAENDEIAVIQNLPSPTMGFYNGEDLTLIEEVALQRNFPLEMGPIQNASIFENRFYYNFVYPQPAILPEGPAVYDLQTGEHGLIDLAGILSEVETEVGQNIEVTTQRFDEVSRVFLVGFAATSSNTISGGVVQISEDGTRFEIFEFPFFPTYFVRN